MRHTPNLSSASYVRNFVFGVEDSLVSTTGLLSGVAFAGLETRVIFTAGVILVFVEAFSMAMGSFLSEHSAEGYLRQSEVPLRRPLIDSGIMFVSYLVSGTIPLFPYLLWPSGSALWYSAGFSLAALFLLGVAGAKMSQTRILKNGLRMLLVGGFAVLLGMAVGQIAHGF